MCGTAVENSIIKVYIFLLSGIDVWYASLSTRPDDILNQYIYYNVWICIIMYELYCMDMYNNVWVIH